MTLCAQRVLYCRQTADVNYPDAIQLVANVSNHHHLISFHGKRRPVIFIYDKQLQLISKERINFEVPLDSDIKIIPLKDFYFLYLHSAKTNTHELWKIEGNGNIANLSDSLKSLIQSQFKDRSFKLTSVENQLYVIASTFYKDISKVNTTIVLADSMLKPVVTRNVFYSFDPAETLHELLLVNRNDLMVLKTSSSDDLHIMELLKINIHDGSTIVKSFRSKGSRYSLPGILYNAQDSGTVVYARLGAHLGASRATRVAYICPLDYSFEEKAKNSLVSRLNGAGTNFILINNQSPWLAFFNYTLSKGFGRNGSNNSFSRTNDLFTHPDILEKKVYTIPYKDPAFPTGSIRITRLDNPSKNNRDSLVRNDDPRKYIDPTNYARFKMKDKSYLLFSTRYRNKNGLMLVFSNEGKQLITSEVHVHDKNEYMVSQLQLISPNSVLVPYVKGREAGLLKIDID